MSKSSFKSTDMDATELTNLQDGIFKKANDSALSSASDVTDSYIGDFLDDYLLHLSAWGENKKAAENPVTAKTSFT